LLFVVTHHPILTYFSLISRKLNADFQISETEDCHFGILDFRIQIFLILGFLNGILNQQVRDFCFLTQI